MSERAYHQSLRLQNFTAFADASFEFVPGINVFVGENGTGKTHAMKAMYAWQLFRRRDEMYVSDFKQVFQIDDLAHLIRKTDKGDSKADGHFGDEFWYLSPLPSGQFKFNRQTPGSKVPRPVFIPAIDMIGHTKGFLTTYDEYAIDFDLTHRDVVSLLLGPELRERDSESREMINDLETAMGGTLELEGERFYLRTDRGRFSMPAVAEGLRKIATLLRLLQGGWLQPGATLFWDEPEVNLNPVLMDEVVGALLALSRNGVQVFLATHSYVILKELDLQSQEGEVRYFAFAPSDEGDPRRRFRPPRTQPYPRSIRPDVCPGSPTNGQGRCALRMRERSMEFDFGNAKVVRHDEAKPLGEGNKIWPGVDFRVLEPTREFWIEVKDYSYHRIRTVGERLKADKDFEADLASEEFRAWIVGKFLGTTAYLAWTEAFEPREIVYVLLIDSSRRDSRALLGAFGRRLRVSFPKEAPWRHRIDYVVTDFDGFNVAFGDKNWSVERV